ncbi:MAG: protein kinase [Rubrobacter sp.]|nr:protein kinase [Rubrobacter sp.]
MKSFDGYIARTIKGTIIDGRYVLGDLLGSGGMARVFLAHDEALDRDVALKIMWEQYVDNKEFVVRFRREAKSAAALIHPNIISVYNWGCSEDEMHYIAMEYVPGGTLKDYVVSEGALDPGVVTELGSQVTEALGFAHEHGVIHRDVKPQNILLTASGEAKVADFGIARAAGAMLETSISRTGIALGTVGYMSPEQAMGEPVGLASDLYSVGVVLYEMLTGNLPHEAESPIALAIKHVSEPVRPPKELNPAVPEGMNTLVLRLLSKKAEDRHKSMRELAEDLRRVRNGLLPLDVGLVGAETAGAATRINAQATMPLAAVVNKGEKGRKAPWILVVAFALFGLLGGGGWSLLHGLQGQDLAPSQEDSQGVASASAPENKATKESAEAEQAPEQTPSVDTASVKEPTQSAALSSAAPERTFLEQAPLFSAAIDSSTFTSAPENTVPSLEPQPALQPAPAQQDPAQVTSGQQPQAQPTPTPQDPAQVTSGQQAQVQNVSSKTSYDGSSGAPKSSGTQSGQPIEQFFQGSNPSHK